MALRRKSCAAHALQALHQPSKDAVGKAAGAHADSSGEVRAINRRAVSLMSQIVPRLLRMHTISVMVTFGMLYATMAVTFAALFYACGDSCYEDELDRDEDRFLQMVRTPRRLSNCGIRRVAHDGWPSRV